MFPGKTFYNAFVHNDMYEHLVAFSGLLYDHQRLPKNLIFTVRYKTFLPIDQKLRESDEFKNFWSEYRSMADRLGIAKESLWDVLPVAYWSNLLSIDNIRRQLSLRSKGTKQGPVDVDSMDDMDVIHADGSMSFSKEHSASFRLRRVAGDAIWPRARRGRRSAEHRSVQLRGARRAGRVLREFASGDDLRVRVRRPRRRVHGGRARPPRARSRREAHRQHPRGGDPRALARRRMRDDRDAVRRAAARSAPRSMVARWQRDASASPDLAPLRAIRELPDDRTGSSFQPHSA